MSGSQWMEQIEKDIAVINDAVVYQANLVAALDSRLAELRTALRVSGHGSAARIEPPPAEADDIANLRLRIDNLVDALEVAARRIDRLETLVTAQRAAIERHADALQVLMLRGAL
jgi:uncharacterized coiled-coil protein SlyX